MVLLRAEGHGHQRDKVVHPVPPRREGQPREIGGSDAHALVRPQWVRRVGEGVDEEHIRQFGGALRQGLVIQQVRAQQFVQLLEAGVVLRDPDVEQLRALPELDARHRAHAVARGVAHQVGDAGRAVDVGEGEGAHALPCRFLQERIGLQYAVLEAEPAVAVEVHGDVRSGGRLRAVRSGRLAARGIASGSGVCSFLAASSLRAPLALRFTGPPLPSLADTTYFASMS